MSRPLSKNTRLIIAITAGIGLLGILVPTAFWLHFGYQYKNQQISITQNYFTKGQLLSVAQTNYDKLPDKLSALKSLLVTKGTWDELKTDLTKLAKKNQLQADFDWVNQIDATTSNQSLKIQVTGLPGDILNFINKIETRPEYIEVENLEIDADYDTSTALIIIKSYLPL